MKKLLIWLLALAGLAAAGDALYSRRTSSSAQTAATGSSGSTAVSWKNGTYTGAASANAYGTVQVRAVVAGGRLTDAQFLQMPNDSGHTQEVTAMAEPALKQEAISAQSSQVDIVSGATQTSESFVSSLQSALGQAQG